MLRIRFILFSFILLCILLHTSLYADVVATWDGNIVNGKITRIKGRRSGNKVSGSVTIINSFGTFTIEGVQIFGYWITENAGEDIKIFKKLGKALTEEDEANIAEEFSFGQQQATDIHTESTIDTTIDTTVTHTKDVTADTSLSLLPIKPNLLTGIGIASLATGGLLLGGGVGLLIYDTIHYYTVVEPGFQKSKDQSLSIGGYEAYFDSYIMYTAFLAAGIASLSTGALLTLLGIPLVVSGRKLAARFTLNFNRNIEFIISFKV